MTQMGLATLALVLRCALLPGCMGAMRSMRGAAGQLGSDSSEGKRAWSLPDIAELPLGWPRLPDWELPWPGGSNPAANNPSLTPLDLPMDGSLGRPNPLGPLGTACLLNGLAGLTMDAYGYIGTAGQNANLAFNVMYNMMSCGAAGGSGSSGSGSSGNGGSTSSIDWWLYGDVFKQVERVPESGPKWGAVVQYGRDGSLHKLGLYDELGRIIYHVDAPDPKTPFWHYHSFPPGNPAPGHGTGAPHIPIDNLSEFLLNLGFDPEDILSKFHE